MRRADCWPIRALVATMLAAAPLALVACSTPPAPPAPDLAAAIAPVQGGPAETAFFANPAGDILLHVLTQPLADAQRLITRTIRGGPDDAQVTRIATHDGPSGRTLLWIEGAGQDARIEFSTPLPQPDPASHQQSSPFADAPLNQPITHTSPITVTRGDRRLPGQATQAVTITARDPQTGHVSACTIDMTITIGPSRTVTRTQRTFTGTELFTEDRTLKVFVLGVRIENKHEQWSRVR